MLPSTMSETIGCGVASTIDPDASIYQRAQRMASSRGKIDPPPSMKVCTATEYPSAYLGNQFISRYPIRSVSIQPIEPGKRYANRWCVTCVDARYAQPRLSRVLKSAYARSASNSGTGVQNHTLDNHTARINGLPISIATTYNPA